MYKISEYNIDNQPQMTPCQVTPFQPLEALPITRYSLACHGGYLFFIPLDPEEFPHRNDSVIRDFGDGKVTSNECGE